MDFLNTAIDKVKGFGNDLKPLTGNIPKAMLFVRDFTGDEGRERLMDDANKKAKSKDVRELRKLIKQRKKTSQEKKTGQLLKSAGIGDGSFGAGGGNGASKEEMIQQLKASNYLAFEVQFNPNKIALTTRAGKITDYKSLGDAGRQQLTTVDLTAATTLSIQLIFDDMNIQDAFVREGNILTNPTVGNVVSTVQSVVTNAKGGYSVKNQTEGLLSLLAHQQTRDVIFTWCEMFFHGMVTDITAQYTMFNKLGNPVRSTVDMTIRQADSGVEYESDRMYWDDAFTAAFGAAGTKMQAKTDSVVSKAMGGWFNV